MGRRRPWPSWPAAASCGERDARRLAAVLRVVYLTFNAGYGPPVRRELCNEAIRLAAMLALLMPDESEVHGLHALLLFQDARR